LTHCSQAGDRSSVHQPVQDGRIPKLREAGGRKNVVPGCLRPYLSFNSKEKSDRSDYPVVVNGREKERKEKKKGRRGEAAGVKVFVYPVNRERARKGEIRKRGKKKKEKNEEKSAATASTKTGDYRGRVSDRKGGEKRKGGKKT